MSCTTQPMTCQSPRVSCILHVPPAARAHSIPRRVRKPQRAAAQGGAGAETPGNSLFANNPQFAAALQSVAARQGDEALYSAPPAVEPEEQTTPHEEMLLTSLQISRRNIRNFESMKKILEKSIESEEQQFERLHFAYKKIKSEGAYIKHLERRLAQEKAKNQGH
ncbi:hypothetical protein ABBQ38_014483 [Trebouxia sp. C0009 RCD-2024]